MISELEQILIDSHLIYKIDTNVDGYHLYPEKVVDKDFNDRVANAIAAIEKLMVRERLDEVKLNYDQTINNPKWPESYQFSRSSMARPLIERIEELQKQLNTCDCVYGDGACVLHEEKA